MLALRLLSPPSVVCGGIAVAVTEAYVLAGKIGATSGMPSHWPQSGVALEVVKCKVGHKVGGESRVILFGGPECGSVVTAVTGLLARAGNNGAAIVVSEIVLSTWLRHNVQCRNE